MIPDHDGYLIPPDPEPIGPCADCPGQCPIEDHWDDDETGEAGCEQHPECGGYVEVTHDDWLADEGDRIYSEWKERL